MLFLFITACKDETKDSSPGLNEKYKFKASLYASGISGNFNAGAFHSFLTDSSVKYFDTLKYFYKSRNYKPVFLNSFDDQDFIYGILNVFTKSEEHGLEPTWYHRKLIEEEFIAAINDSTKNEERYKHLSNAELLIADGILKYAYHLRYGVVNPKEIFFDSYFLPVADSVSRSLFEPLSQNDLIKYLHSIQPKSEKYIRLQKALKDYAQYKDIEWTILPIPAKKIEIGNRDTLLVDISAKLIALGFLDTSKVIINDFTLYDSVFALVIKDFQKINGLTEDGVIGKTTIERLNVSPQENINKIKINLERFRWNDYSDTAQYIVVNIPDFRLRVVENKIEKISMRVCTGKKRPASYNDRYKYYLKTKRWQNKPDDWETPNLYSQISYMVLNPTWTVPPSIIREEIVAGIRKDSSYLVKKNFKVYKDGIEVDLAEVSMENLYKEKIPYRIVQDPGAGNALGRIKFMFNNPFGVYLHDTPTRAPFNYSNRAVSHGCVRVEQPLLLSEYILNSHSKWNNDYLKIEIGQTINDKTKISEYYRKRSELRRNTSYGKTTELKLEKKIPLFIDYYTAWVDADGRLQLREDVYDRDKVLLTYLAPKRII